MQKVLSQMLLVTMLVHLQSAHPAQKRKNEQPELTMGELALFAACKTRDSEHVTALMKTYHVSPQFKDPKTGETPLALALEGLAHEQKPSQERRQMVRSLLAHGSKPHAGLPRTRTVYSGSFEAGNDAAVKFLMSQRLSYVPKRLQSHKPLCRTLDLERLIRAGNIQCLKTAFKAGLIIPSTVTPAILADTRKMKAVDPQFAHEALAFLTQLGEKRNVGRIRRR